MPNTRVDLQTLTFGNDVAELDTQLIDYFVQTPSFHHIRNRERMVVIGRKGSGKTALFKYFDDGAAGSDAYVVPIEATHNTYVKLDERMRSFATQVKNLDSSFKLAWMFTTLLALINRMMMEKSALVTREESELYAFAKQRLDYTPADPISAMAEYAADWVRNLKRLGPVERDTTHDRSVPPYDEPRLVNMIALAVDRIRRKGMSTYLFYDKLDERWDGSPLYIAFLQGLLLAAKDIKTHCSTAAPVILVRDDIFDLATLGFQHSDHFRMLIEHISWDEASLVELLATRIRSSLRRQGARDVEDVADEEVWHAVFPESMPAKKQPTPTTAYMIERTLLRPRDLILFANYARDQAIKAKHPTVAIDDIKSAEDRYSADKVNDLVNETSYRFGGINLLLDEFRRGPIGRDLDDLRLFVLECKDRIEGQCGPWCQGDEDEIIKLLYQIGFLSFTRKGGTLRGTRVIHSAVEPDPRVILDQSRLFVSPIFRRGLDLAGA